MQKNSKLKARVDYPCLWQYKIIGEDVKQMQDIVSDIVTSKTHTLTLSNSSSAGKYHCLNLELQVDSATERDSLYERLKQSPVVRMVL